MEDKIEERKKKLRELFTNKKKYVIYALLFLIILTGFVIRTADIPNLQGKYMLSVDDPYIFLRYSKYIAEHGELMEIDKLRYAPLGLDTDKAGPLVAYVHAYIYWILKPFIADFTIYDANIIYAPIFFVLMAFVFYLLVSKLFNYRAGLLATAYLAVLPPFLYRTMGGFNDKEPFGMLFMFLSLLFYVLGLHNNDKRFNLGYGILAGLCTTIMGLSWGGVGFLLLILPTVALIELLLNKFTDNDAYTYFGWFLAYFITLLIFGERYGGVTGILKSYLFDYTLFGFFVILSYILFFKYNLFKIKERFQDKLPEGIVTIIFSLLFVLVAGSLVLGPGFIFGQFFSFVDDFLIHPIGTARFQLTVAENRQPTFGTWVGDFSLQYFLMFFMGSILLYYKLIEPIKKHRIKLMLLYILFIVGFMFSRYGGSGRIAQYFDGATSISRFVYGGSLVLFVLGWGIFYLRSYYKDKEMFNQILKLDKNTILVFVWFVFMLVGARTAIRLIFTFVPITAVMAGYFVDYFYERRNEFAKYVMFSLLLVLISTYLAKFVSYFSDKFFMNLGTSAIITWIILLGLNQFKLENKSYKLITIIVLAILLISPFARGSLTTFSLSTYAQAKNTGSGYHNQYQSAMEWIRENTPKEAVFSHWWDYGYIVQEEGQRATVGDPGNFYGYWNHLLARHLLTGQNDIETLEFLKAHNVSYILIIAEDIGKYGAYSSIGGDENNDRASWITTYGLDTGQTVETRDGTVFVYTGGFGLDEDFAYNNVLFPRGSAIIGAVLVNARQVNETLEFRQPELIIAYKGQQHRVPLECLYFDGSNDNIDNGQLLEFNNGYKGCFRIVPAIGANNVGNILGAGILLSERVRRTFMANYYVLGKESENFRLVYQDDVPLAAYRGSTVGPFKIWKVNYPAGIKFRAEYLNTTWPSKELYAID